MKPTVFRKNNSIGMLFYFLLLCTVLHGGAHAEVDFFRSPENKTSSTPDLWRESTVGNKKLTILFFIFAACGACPKEASRLETELKQLGWKYEIEGIFVGNPTQVEKYLAELRSYPFNFELELDMDGMIAKKYGVKTFPTAVIEVDGKRALVTRASKLSEKLR
jgi:peroxiredoxin